MNSCSCFNKIIDRALATEERFSLKKVTELYTFHFITSKNVCVVKRQQDDGALYGPAFQISAISSCSKRVRDLMASTDVTASLPAPRIDEQYLTMTVVVG